ncbi:MAG TPA: DUF1697 domain-containing protein [Bryobacteraceae bacterium]|nr:DUF1697 domain-containing protein [Bryobacteraceae bacterium]
MAVIVSLLRGVNLASHHRMSMPHLKAVYESLKLRDVTTLLQSGNVVFQSNARDLPALARRIEKAIEDRFGFPAPVALRTTDEMRQIVAACPFASRKGLDPARLAVTFFPGDAVAIVCDGPEEVHNGRREAYIYFTNGFARTKVRTPATGTARNWNTVRKLLDLAEEMESRTARPPR